MDFKKQQDDLFSDAYFETDEEQTRHTSRLKNSLSHQGRNNHFYGQTHRPNVRKRLQQVAKSRTKDVYCKHCRKRYTQQAYDQHHGDYCVKNPNRVIKSRKKKVLSGPQTMLVCPHCKYTGGEGNMKRYHMDNCDWKGKHVASYRDGKLVKVYKSLPDIIKTGMLHSKIKACLDKKSKRAYLLEWKYIDK